MSIRQTTEDGDPALASTVNVPTSVDDADRILTPRRVDGDRDGRTTPTPRSRGTTPTPHDSDARRTAPTPREPTDETVSRDDAGRLPTMPTPRGGSPTPSRRARRETNAAGKQVGRYTLLERLGTGGMGVVYLADDPQLHRKVALKVLQLPDPALSEQLVREARVMAKITHPNVVTVFDIGVADGSTYIAMEVVDGASLASWQANRSVTDIIAAYVEAGRGLAAAHAAGIVHRDFKPDNVLVGGDGRVRVTDFGLAAHTVEPSGDLIVGTPAYMAPEQFEGGNIDARTDQFNFCVALYEALYGERPFEGTKLLDIRDHVVAGRIRPAPAKSRVASAVRAIVLRGLSPRPGDRFPTMTHLLAELARDRAKPWRRVGRAAAVLAGILALGLVADGIAQRRLEDQIRDSFRATGVQLDRELRLRLAQFDAMSHVTQHLPVLRQVAAHHDEADFGLGTAQDDAADLVDVHNTLMSADLTKLDSTVLAIADYKGRLLYTSAAPSSWNVDLAKLPVVHTALANATNAIAVVDSGELASLHLSDRRTGIAVVYVRALALGGSTGALHIQVVDGNELLDRVRLGDGTLLSLRSPNGAFVGDVPDDLVADAPPDQTVAELSAGGASYQVQSLPLRGVGPATIGRVVMARPSDGVLSLFPHARFVLALTMLLAMASAIATLLRARRLAAC